MAIMNTVSQKSRENSRSNSHETNLTWGAFDRIIVFFDALYSDLLIVCIQS